jgi:hypothetical protein
MLGRIAIMATHQETGMYSSLCGFRRRWLSPITLAVLLTSLTASAQAGINLKGPALRYGNFDSYSLPLLELLYPGEDFLVQSGSGQIKDYVVIAAGSDGNDETRNFAQV